MIFFFFPSTFWALDYPCYPNGSDCNIFFHERAWHSYSTWCRIFRVIMQNIKRFFSNLTGCIKIWKCMHRCHQRKKNRLFHMYIYIKTDIAMKHQTATVSNSCCWAAWLKTGICCLPLYWMGMMWKIDRWCLHCLLCSQRY